MRCNERARYRFAAWLVLFGRRVETAGGETCAALSSACSRPSRLRLDECMRAVHAGIPGARRSARRAAPLSRRWLVARRRSGAGLGEAGAMPGASRRVNLDDAVFYQPTRLAVR